MGSAAVLPAFSNHDVMNSAQLVFMGPTAKASASAGTVPDAILLVETAPVHLGLSANFVNPSATMEGSELSARKSANATGNTRWDVTTFLEAASVHLGLKVCPVIVCVSEVSGAPRVKTPATARTIPPATQKPESAFVRGGGWARIATSHVRPDSLARIVRKCVLTACTRTAHVTTSLESATVGLAIWASAAVSHVPPTGGVTAAPKNASVRMAASATLSLAHVTVCQGGRVTIAPSLAPMGPMASTAPRSAPVKTVACAVQVTASAGVNMAGWAPAVPRFVQRDSMETTACRPATAKRTSSAALFLAVCAAMVSLESTATSDLLTEA